MSFCVYSSVLVKNIVSNTAGTPGKRARMGTDDEGDPAAKQTKLGNVEYRIPIKNAFTELAKASERARKPPGTASVYQEDQPPKQMSMPPVTVPINTNPETNEVTSKPDTVLSIVKSVTNQFRYKNSDDGLMIFAVDFVTHNSIRAALKKQNVFHYSHPAGGGKQKRFVLYGLDKQNPDDIKLELAEKGIQPKSINCMFTNKPRFPGQCNYVLYFEGTSSITLSQLKDIRVVNYTMVSWANYKAKQSGVSPCRHCCLFGHGATNCSMPARCIVCAGNHVFTECKYILAKHAGGHSSIHPRHIKCANCGLNHTATFKDCKTRLDYIDKVQSRNQSRRKPQRAQPVLPQQQAPQLNEIGFPTPVYATPAYNQNRSTGPSMAKFITQQPSSQSTQDDLYTMNECREMLDTLFNALQQCRSKVEQAKVIGDYALTYLCKFT